VMIMEPCTGRSTITNVAEVLSAVTGWDLSVEDLMEIGARSNAMARAFNCREGLTREEDKIPTRFSQAFGSGGSQGQVVSPEDMNKMLDEFYAAAGWSSQGVPTRATLTKLGIGWVADSLEGRAPRPVPAR
jgi:aldehyde:ferredoxin oxidoreductase